MEGNKFICAWVRADSENYAKEIIKEYWSEAINWRFCDAEGDRFPLKDWSPAKKNKNDGKRRS